MNTKTRIFDLLDEKGIEQKALAAMIGVSSDTVSNWRVGKSNSYTRYLVQIAQALETTPEYLLTGEKSSPSPERDELRQRIDRLTPENTQKLMDFLAYIEARQGNP